MFVHKPTPEVYQTKRHTWKTPTTCDGEHDIQCALLRVDSDFPMLLNMRDEKRCLQGDLYINRPTPDHKLELNVDFALESMFVSKTQINGFAISITRSNSKLNVIRAGSAHRAMWNNYNVMN